MTFKSYYNVNAFTCSGKCYPVFYQFQSNAQEYDYKCVRAVKKFQRLIGFLRNIREIFVSREFSGAEYEHLIPAQYNHCRMTLSHKSPVQSLRPKNATLTS